MNAFTSDQDFISAAYTYGGRKEAVAAFFALLDDLTEEWPAERIQSTTVFVRDLPRTEDQPASA